MSPAPYVGSTEALRLALRRWDDPTHLPVRSQPPEPVLAPVAPPEQALQEQALQALPALAPVDLTAWD